MKIIIASSNQGKIKEIKKFFNMDTYAYSEIMDYFDIVEDADTFKGNAILKAEAINNKLTLEQKKEFIVLSDDSGITVPSLGNVPGIYSARYAGTNATSKDNLAKLINTLKENNLDKTPAYYTCAIAVIANDRLSTTHGWMHGNVIDEERGTNGFGYDPMFIPEGFNTTLGEMSEDIKKELSHRTQALNLAKYFI